MRIRGNVPTMMRPKLLHLTTVDSSLVHLLLPQLLAFREAGFDVVGVSATGPFIPQLEAAGIQHIALRNSTRRNAPWYDVAAFFEFLLLCRRLKPDIVHTHNPKPGVWGRIAARVAGVPRVVNTVHGLYATPTDSWLRRTLVYSLERIASAFSHAELLQNEEDLPVLVRLGIPESKLTVIGNGIDLVRFDPNVLTPDAREIVRSEWGVAPDTVVVGAVGRMVAEKGWRELFAAIETLRAQGCAVVLVAIGSADPDKADALSDTELAEARASGVILPGWQNTIEHSYPGFDIFCLPSWREGFPRAAMEAAAMGLPIVATDIRGCRQVVEDGVNGTLVPVRDQGSLANAIRVLAQDAKLRAKLGSSGRLRAVRDFDFRQQVVASLHSYGHRARPDLATLGT
jgi:glycosyltransferase involved in cell wall biosynthesis